MSLQVALATALIRITRFLAEERLELQVGGIVVALEVSLRGPGQGAFSASPGAPGGVFGSIAASLSSVDIKASLRDNSLLLASVATAVMHP